MQPEENRRSGQRLDRFRPFGELLTNPLECLHCPDRISLKRTHGADAKTRANGPSVLWVGCHYLLIGFDRSVGLVESLVRRRCVVHPFRNSIAVRMQAQPAQPPLKVGERVEPLVLAPGCHHHGPPQDNVRTKRGVTLRIARAVDDPLRCGPCAWTVAKHVEVVTRDLEQRIVGYRAVRIQVDDGGEIHQRLVMTAVAREGHAALEAARGQHLALVLGSRGPADRAASAGEDPGDEAPPSVVATIAGRT